MSTAQQDRPADRAGAPPVPVTLRAIAAWLESHDAIKPHYIRLAVTKHDRVAVQVYCLESYEAAAHLMADAGLRWKTRDSGTDGELFALTAEIMPGVDLELFGEK